VFLASSRSPATFPPLGHPNFLKKLPVSFHHEHVADNSGGSSGHVRGRTHDAGTLMIWRQSAPGNPQAFQDGDRKIHYLINYLAMNPAAAIASAKQAVPFPSTMVNAIFISFGLRLGTGCFDG
jgi:hypothetical protein